MSHEIQIHDKQQGTEMAWHGLTEVLPVIVLANCFLSTWDVVKQVLFAIGEDGKQIKTDFCRLVCSDNPEIVIGSPVHCETYTVLSNKRFVEIAQSVIDSITGAVVSSVGSVCNRARIFISIRVPEMQSFIAAGREFKPYLNLLSSHDKSAPFIVNMSTICTVCNNTFGANLHDSENRSLRLKITHSKNMADKLENVPEIIKAYLASVQQFADTLNKFASQPISTDETRAFFAGFLDANSNETLGTADELRQFSTRRMNQIDRLTELFLTGKGNNGKNLADVFSAVTDYYSHESSGGENPFKQVASSEFGNGATMKAAAYALLQDDKKLAKIIAKGSKLLAAQKE